MATKKRWWVTRIVWQDGEPIITKWTGLRSKARALYIFDLECRKADEGTEVAWGEGVPPGERS